jgi:two-component system cell cycle sensor histidine kinase/response regulator CckA
MQHDILTSTLMRLGVLRENRQLPADVSSQILALDAKAKRSADLTKKLVSFGQRQFLRMEPMNLRESVARLQPEIVRLLGKGIELRLTGGASPVWVEADSSAIDQVIVSLCTNARDAMAQGGCLTVDVTRIDGSPAASAPDGGPRPGSVVRLSFEDKGSGMDSSVRQRLFEPFFTTMGVGGGWAWDWRQCTVS